MDIGIIIINEMFANNINSQIQLFANLNKLIWDIYQNVYFHLCIFLKIRAVKFKDYMQSKLLLSIITFMRNIINISI